MSSFHVNSDSEQSMEEEEGSLGVDEGDHEALEKSLEDEEINFIS